MLFNSLFKTSNKKRLYADAAASTPLSARVRDELLRLLELYGNAGALHKEAVDAKNEIEHARKKIADAIGAHADEVIFTASGTEANNLALHRARGHVVTTLIEHSSVLEPLRNGEASVTEVGVNSEGIVDVEEIKNSITPETTLVSVQMVNSEIGTIQPIREIAKILKGFDRKIMLHVDASQAPLWIDIKVDALHVDLLTLDAQKILGPKGVGALYVRRGVELEPLIRGGGQEKNMRAGTENTLLMGAFAIALKDAQQGTEERAKKVSEIRNNCFEEIKKLIPDVILNGATIEGGARVANNLNISIPGLEAQMAVIALDAEGIAVSTRSACDVGSDEPSHVIQAIGIAPDLAGTAIRITFLPDIKMHDTVRIARALEQIAKRYRKVI